MKGQLLLNLQPQEKFVSRETIVRLLCMQIKQEVGQTQTLSLVTAYEFISLFLSSCLPSAPGFSLFLPLNDAHLSLSFVPIIHWFVNEFFLVKAWNVRWTFPFSFCLSFFPSVFLSANEGRKYVPVEKSPSFILFLPLLDVLLSMN